MILLTVGTQLPFDRLIADMDALATRIGRKIFGQIGASDVQPKHFEYSKMLHPVEFDKLCRASELIVSHAGIGSILMAQKYQKPIVIYPRQAKFGEHRNDHQLATCKNVGTYEGIYPARDREELFQLLNRTDLVAPDSKLISQRQGSFIDNLKSHILSLS
jgi:UDP-N-acetylglucosamine transferase subunit ALG13